MKPRFPESRKGKTFDPSSPGDPGKPIHPPREPSAPIGKRMKSSMLTSFFLYFTVVSFVPLVVLGILSAQVASRSVLSAQNSAMESILRAQNDIMESIAGQAENLLSAIVGTDSISEAIDSPATGDEYLKLATQARIGYVLSNFLSIKGLSLIHLWVPGGLDFRVGSTLYSENLREDLKSQIFNLLSVSEKSILWLGVSESLSGNDSGQKVVNVARLITRMDKTKFTSVPRAVLMLSFDPDTFGASLSEAAETTGARFMLIDVNGKIVAHSDSVKAGSAVQARLLADLDGKATTRHHNDDRGRNLLFSRRVERTGWTLVALMPESILLRKTWDIYLVTMGCAFIMFIGTLLFTIIVLRRWVTPLRSISSAFRALGQGSLDENFRLKAASLDEVGDLVRWFNAYLESIREKRRMDQALLASEARYSLVARATNEGLWELDIGSGKAFFSERFVQMLDFDSQEFGSDPEAWFSRIHPQDRPEFDRELAAHLRGESPVFKNEYRICRKAGQYIWVSTRGLALHDPGSGAMRMAGSNSDVTDRRRAEDRLRFEAEYDMLTGLHNRKWLNGKLESILRRVGRTGGDPDYGIIFLDLDHFKLINDTRGHNVGDKVLVAVAERLRSCVRDPECLARLGGDEFVVLVDHDPERNAQLIVDNIERALDVPIDLDEGHFLVTASIGVNIGRSEYSATADVLRDADIAMYKAKAGGRARREYFDDTMREDVFRRMELENELHTAVRNDGIAASYQPIVRASDGVCLGFEALARWPHAEFGLVMPGIFIPLAEESSLILELGRYMIRKAARQVAQWKRAYPDRSFYVSVNLSPFQIKDSFLIKKMVESILEEGATPQDLVLELTESAFIEDPAMTGSVIESARKEGFRIFLDDFGTGYSSIGYLKDYHFDAIKIDRQFVAGIGDDARVARLLEVFTELAGVFDLGIIIEGVEQKEQLDLLAGIHVDAVQGDFFSRPIDAQAAANWIESMPIVPSGENPQ